MNDESRQNNCRSWTLPTDFEAVHPLCHEIRSILSTLKLESLCFSVDLILREFLNNAMIHGNKRDKKKYVKIKMLFYRQWIIFSIFDQGKGFDRQLVQNGEYDPFATSGRGLKIGRLYADRIRYNKSGNKVAIWIKSK